LDEIFLDEHGSNSLFYLVCIQTQEVIFVEVPCPHLKPLSGLSVTRWHSSTKKGIEKMVLDLLSLIGVIGYGLLGVRRGAAYQVVRLLSLLGALYVARSISPNVGGVIESTIGLDGLPAQVLAFAAVTITAHLVLRVLLYPFHALFKGGREESGSMNRALGGVFAIVMATAFIYATLSGTVLLNARFGNPLGNTVFDPSESAAASACSHYNLVGALQIPHKEALRALAHAKIREEQGLPQGDADADAQYVELLQHDKATFLNDAGLVQAILDERWSRVIAEPSVWLFLTDPDVVDTLLATTLPPADPSTI
jgi:uncharacterized membrane protein required for colicin V production